MVLVFGGGAWWFVVVAVTVRRLQVVEVSGFGVCVVVLVVAGSVRWC